MINFTKQPEQIGEEIISYYRIQLGTDRGETSNCKLAIYLIENMLIVVPKTVLKHKFFGLFEFPNPTYTTLKSVLEILNSKLK